MNVPDGFRMLEDRGPFLELVGPAYVSGGVDSPLLGLRVQERHANLRGTVMGGMLATPVDVAFGVAIEADAEDAEDRATVSLTVDYLKPASPGRLDRSARQRQSGGQHTCLRRLLAQGWRGGNRAGTISVGIGRLTAEP